MAGFGGRSDSFVIRSFESSLRQASNSVYGFSNSVGGAADTVTNFADAVKGTMGAGKAHQATITKGVLMALQMFFNVAKLNVKEMMGGGGGGGLFGGGGGSRAFADQGQKEFVSHVNRMQRDVDRLVNNPGKTSFGKMVKTMEKNSKEASKEKGGGILGMLMKGAGLIMLGKAIWEPIIKPFYKKLLEGAEDAKLDNPQTTLGKFLSPLMQFWEGLKTGKGKGILGGIGNFIYDVVVHPVSDAWSDEGPPGLIRNPVQFIKGVFTGKADIKNSWGVVGNDINAVIKGSTIGSFVLGGLGSAISFLDGLVNGPSRSTKRDKEDGGAGALGESINKILFGVPVVGEDGKVTRQGGAVKAISAMLEPGAAFISGLMFGSKQPYAGAASGVGKVWWGAGVQLHDLFTMGLDKLGGSGGSGGQEADPDKLSGILSGPFGFLSGLISGNEVTGEDAVAVKWSKFGVKLNTVFGKGIELVWKGAGWLVSGAIGFIYGLVTGDKAPLNAEGKSDNGAQDFGAWVHGVFKGLGDSGDSGGSGSGFDFGKVLTGPIDFLYGLFVGAPYEKETPSGAMLSGMKVRALLKSFGKKDKTEGLDATGAEMSESVGLLATVGKAVGDAAMATVKSPIAFIEGFVKGEHSFGEAGGVVKGFGDIGVAFHNVFFEGGGWNSSFSGTWLEGPVGLISGLGGTDVTKIEGFAAGGTAKSWNAIGLGIHGFFSFIGGGLGKGAVVIGGFFTSVLDFAKGMMGIPLGKDKEKTKAYEWGYDLYEFFSGTKEFNKTKLGQAISPVTDLWGNITNFIGAMFSGGKFTVSDDKYAAAAAMGSKIRDVFMDIVAAGRILIGGFQDFANWFSSGPIGYMLGFEKPLFEERYAQKNLGYKPSDEYLGKRYDRDRIQGEIGDIVKELGREKESLWGRPDVMEYGNGELREAANVINSNYGAFLKSSEAYMKAQRAYIVSGTDKDKKVFEKVGAEWMRMYSQMDRAYRVLEGRSLPFLGGSGVGVQGGGQEGGVNKTPIFYGTDSDRNSACLQPAVNWGSQQAYIGRSVGAQMPYSSVPHIGEVWGTNENGEPVFFGSEDSFGVGEGKAEGAEVVGGSGVVGQAPVLGEVESVIQRAIEGIKDTVIDGLGVGGGVAEGGEVVDDSGGVGLGSLRKEALVRAEGMRQAIMDTGGEYAEYAKRRGGEYMHGGGSSEVSGKSINNSTGSSLGGIPQSLDPGSRNAVSSPYFSTGPVIGKIGGTLSHDWAKKRPYDPAKAVMDSVGKATNTLAPRGKMEGIWGGGELEGVGEGGEGPSLGDIFGDIKKYLIGGGIGGVNYEGKEYDAKTGVQGTIVRALEGGIRGIAGSLGTGVEGLGKVLFGEKGKGGKKGEGDKKEGEAEGNVSNGTVSSVGVRGGDLAARWDSDRSLLDNFSKLVGSGDSRDPAIETNKLLVRLDRHFLDMLEFWEKYGKVPGEPISMSGGRRVRIGDTEYKQQTGG